MMVMTFAAASSSALLGLFLGGCGVLGATACTDIGAQSGVSFEFGDVVDAHPNESLVVEACVAEACESLLLRGNARDRDQMRSLGVDLRTDGRPVPVTLKVTDGQGDEVYEGKLVAHPVKEQVNGPGCPPTTWSALVTASGTSDLRQTGPSSD